MVLLFSLVVALTAVASISAAPFVVSPSPTQATNYQKWAHYHWVWLKNGDGNQANETAFIQGYKDNNIPVGALNIDSTWATQFNNFVVDTSKFPDFKGMVSDFHDQGIKVILWATSMVNVENPDYDMCVQNQYLLRDSRGIVRPLEWWHGKGGLLDYTNPDAVAWWHAQMDLVLDAGVDGFKCDGTDPYIDEYTLTGGALGYNDQVVTYREYANSYYRDFFDHTRARRSDGVPGADDGLIMSRPVDCLIDGVSKACTPFSPYNVMYSGWMGDDDSSFLGLRACAHKVIYSAWMGYGNYGCDIGGYRGNDDTKYATHFLRSAQLNAFLPLMENGGGGEHRPWMYEEEYVLPVYRKFVQQHYRLSAYLLTNGANAVDSNTSSIHPLDYRTLPDITEFSLQQEKDAAVSVDQSSRDAVTNHHINAQRVKPTTTTTSSTPALSRDHEHKIHIVFPNPTTLAYTLGQDLLVHPIMYDQDNHTAAAVVKVDFPELSDVIPSAGAEQGTVWLDWWHPADAKKSHKAGTSAMLHVPIDTFPVFVRKNAFIPLHPLSFAHIDAHKAVDDEKLLLDASTSVDMERVVFTWFGPSAANDASHPVVYKLRESISEGTGMVATASLTEDTIVATISAHKGALGAGVSIVGVSEPTSVVVDAWAGARCVHAYTTQTSTFTVSCASVAGGLKVTLSGVAPMM